MHMAKKTLSVRKFASFLVCCFLCFKTQVSDSLQTPVMFVSLDIISTEMKLKIHSAQTVI